MGTGLLFHSWKGAVWISMELIVCAMLGSGVSRIGGDGCWVYMVYIWCVCFR